MSMSIDYDEGRWLYVPNEFPWESFVDDEHWADAVSKAFAEGTTPPPADLTGWLREYLLGAARGNTSGAIRFAHLPSIDAPTAIVDIYELPADPAIALEELTQQGAGPALRDPDVAPFDSDGLGGGVKATRYVTNERGGIVRATHWVWRTSGRDIVMLTGSGDLAVAEALDPLMDDLARSLSLTD